MSQNYSIYMYYKSSRVHKLSLWIASCILGQTQSPTMYYDTEPYFVQLGKIQGWLSVYSVGFWVKIYLPTTLPLRIVRSFGRDRKLNSSCGTIKVACCSKVISDERSPKFLQSLTGNHYDVFSMMKMLSSWT